MPSPYLKKLSRETGKSVNELEKYWDKAKSITAEDFGVSESDFESKHWAYATGIVKNMAGVKERNYSVQDFLESEKSIDEYISELVTSGDFPKLDKDVVGKKDDEEDNDEEDDENDMDEETEITDKEIEEQVDKEIDKEKNKDSKEIKEKVEEPKVENTKEKPKVENFEKILEEYKVAGAYPTEADVIVELINDKEDQKWIRFPTMEEAKEKLGFDDSLIEY